MADNILVRLPGTRPWDTIPIMRDVPTSIDEPTKLWAQLPEIKRIIYLHSNSSVYTWTLVILPARSGLHTVVMYDYLNHREYILPMAVDAEGNLLYEVTRVPLVYS